MFRLLIVSLFLIMGSIASASTVKVTSFRFVDSGRYYSAAAEFCGQLVAPTGKYEMIKIISDPASKNPAHYFAWSGKDGKFCQMIATFTGQAEAELAP